ncbi:MAG: hypothetical protein RL488_266 [Actinomycetota bacterium]|jgi:cytoplasmic iron level regulating protein YaaA (DUF328/UPF0246 family)
MLFLLPPSETKEVGGSPLSISQVALTFGGLNPARDAVYEALRAVCERPEEAAKVLKLGKKQLDQIAINLEVQDAPTMPAINRYTGTLYDAIHGRGRKGTPTEHNQITKEMFERAKDTVLIQSALFGLIPATNLIPNYRLSGTTNLPGISLKDTWTPAHEPIWKRLEDGPIIDLRSKAYAELAPIPEDVEHFWVEVLDSNSGKALNHFNKKGKGQLINAVLNAKVEPKTIADLKKIAESIGQSIQLDGSVINLYV